MLNLINDAEYLRFGDYIPDCTFKNPPTADRVRAKWKKYNIVKMKKDKKRGHDSSDDEDDEDARIRRKNEAMIKKLNEPIDPKKYLLEHLEVRLMKGLNENFNSEDEGEENKEDVIDPHLAKIVKVNDGWLDKK
jgi:hypothetical protein